MQRKDSKSNKPKNSIIKYMTIFFTLGILIGSIYAVLIDNSILEPIHKHLENLQSGSINVSRNLIFRESMFKHGMIIVMIFFVSYLPNSNLISLVILSIKGASIGFSSSVLIKYYGTRGLWYITLTFLPQTLIMVISYFSLIYFLREATTAKKYNEKKVLYLLISLIAIVIASFFEAFIIM